MDVNQYSELVDMLKGFGLNEDWAFEAVDEICEILGIKNPYIDDEEEE